MIIINADDWGRSRPETDAALNCYRSRRITSVTAMVFMEDSVRGAELAQEHEVCAGLHLNLNQAYNGVVNSSAARSAHERVARFLSRGKYSMFLYDPRLRVAFRDVFRSQWDEFTRMYGIPPSHVDGHQHRHLCLNVLLNDIIPVGTKVRRNFTFFPGEKSLANRMFRAGVDRWLGRRYLITDYFFSLGDCLKRDCIEKVVGLARSANVELMTHPVVPEEYAWLIREDFYERWHDIRFANYRQFCASGCGPEVQETVRCPAS